MPANPRTEVVALTVTLLVDNWDASFTGDETPHIHDDSDASKRSRGTRGIIAIYEHGPYRRERVDGPGEFKDHRRPVTLKVKAKTRAKLDQLLGEVERVYNAIKNNPEGGGPTQHWDWIDDLGETAVVDRPGVFQTDAEWEYVAHSIVEAT